jgi:MFS family permease
MTSAAPSINNASGASLLRFRGSSSDDVAATSVLPPVDKGFQAWRFLAVATFLEALIWGAGNSYGAFQDYHLYSPQSPLYGRSSAVTAAPGTLITAGQYFAPFLFLGLLNAFPHRIRLFAAITLLVSVASLMAASFHPTPAGVIVLQGFLSGWAGGAFYTPAMLWLPQWFDEKRGLATGVIFLGSGLGGVIWPFIFNTLLQGVGFHWTLRALGGIQLVFGATIMYFLRPRLPIVAPPTSSANAGSRNDPSRRRRNVLRAIMPSHNPILNTPMGITYAVLQFLQNAAFWSVSYYIAPYASSLGLKGTVPTALLAAFNAASAVSYVTTGKLCDILPHTLLVLLASATGSLLVGLLLGFARSIAPLTAFTILYGLFNGGFSCTMAPMAREMARIGGTEHSAVFLEYMAIRGLGGVFGPLVSSVLYIGDAPKEDKIGKLASSIWGANAQYGSHGLGPVIVFATALSSVVAIIALISIPFRKQALQNRN